MKRSATEVLRRGFDSTLANWPLILIRIAEGIVFVGIVIAAVVAAVVPIAVAAGLSKFDISGSSNPAEAVAAAIVQHWMLIVYLLLILTLVLLVLVAIHSFVEAGSAQVFVDAERRAKPVTAPRRDVFNVFSIDRWMAGGRQGWWSIFWIYNATWSVAGLIILIPLLITMVLMVAASEAAGKVVAGCAGLLLSVIVAIPVAVVIPAQGVVAFVGAHPRDLGDAVGTEGGDDVVGPAVVQGLGVGGDAGADSLDDLCIRRRRAHLSATALRSRDRGSACRREPR